MKYEIIDGDAGPCLALRGQLVFADRDTFDAVIDKLLARRKKLAAVDLSGLDYMDSAGLGMLLTLRDRGEREGMEVRLRNPRLEVRQLLDLACFESLFVIEHG